MPQSGVRHRGVLIHISFFPLFVAGLLLSIGCAPRSAADAPLSAEEIATLRDRYPTMSVVYEPTVDVLSYDLGKDLRLISHAYVEVEVLEQLDDIHRGGTINPFEGIDPAVLAEKEKNLGHPIPTIVPTATPGVSIACGGNSVTGRSVRSHRSGTRTHAWARVYRRYDGAQLRLFRQPFAGDVAWKSVVRSFVDRGSV